MVVAACKEPHIVHHGQAGGEKLDGPCQKVVLGISVQCAEVGAVVLVGGPAVGPTLGVVKVLHVGGAAQPMLYHLL